MPTFYSIGTDCRQAWDGLTQGKEDIPVSVAEQSYNAFETKRREFYSQMLERFGAARK